MRILFDHGAPAPLIGFLKDHSVTKAKDLGWERLVKSELLKAAEHAGFDVLVTTYKNIVTQQNLRGRAIAIVVLGNSQWKIAQSMCAELLRRSMQPSPVPTAKWISH